MTTTTRTVKKEVRVAPWYFGGVSGAMAACVTHPLDLIKVLIQTQQGGKVTLPQLCSTVYKSNGILGFYNGLSASILRQMTYTITRFGIYEQAKKALPQDQALPFYQKALLAGFAGACGGLVGTPGDLVNVRMQNDMKLPADQRRNYKHALDGVYRIVKEEGVSFLFGGWSMAVARAIFMTIGQLSFYDQAKQMIIENGLGKDNLATHLSASTIAASMATILTQPMDVLKTRLMNAKPGEFKGVVDCILFTAKLGPAGFFRGLIPAWVRLAPHTICMFIFFEQLRLKLGSVKIVEVEEKVSTA